MPKSLAAVAAATVAALAIAAPPAFAGETPEPVTAHGLVAEVYTPPGPAMRHPAILVIGGSEGGLEGASGEARLLAKQGYVTMALAYFAAPDCPRS